MLQDSVAETSRSAGDEPLFEQLPWTGRNRTRARQTAASAILALVQRIQRNSANEKIFLIGHSHGGSAIAYFLKEHSEAAHIDWSEGPSQFEGIVHSWTYAHPAAIMHLQNWVRASLGNWP
jgi:triacylglycerol esterase/lipase EstA (alpha/beta hydrolase family)